MKKICWVSGGITSAVAGYIALKKYPDIEFIYIDIDSHHQDMKKFLNDLSEKLYKKPITVIKSAYKDQFEVSEKFKFLNSAYGAKCTSILKKRVREEFEHNNKIDLYVWGFEYSKKEIKRAERIKDTMSNYKHYFPLVENRLTKENCMQIIKNKNIEIPEMYKLGFSNNNCIGCVKGGKGYWNLIKIHFPDVFNKMSLLERKINHSCIKNVFLDELKENEGNIKEIIPECGIFCEVINQLD